MVPPAYKKRKLSPLPAHNGDKELSHIRDFGALFEQQSKVADKMASTRSSRAAQNDRRSPSTLPPSSVYHLSLFQLQVDELLSKVRPHEGRMANAENALRKLKNIIERIPNREPQSV